MSVTAKEKTANIEQLRKDMYRLFNKPDSIDKFMQVTDQLIEVSKQKNNEELLYKAWANQAIMFSLVGKRQQALLSRSCRIMPVTTTANTAFSHPHRPMPI